jgi:hypothetical protein
LALFLFVANKTYSETTNQWGSPVFGAQLSISVSNNVIATGSKVFLHCLTTNFSTNGVCFIQTASRGMYEVSIIHASGKSFELNNPVNAGDNSDRWNKIDRDESFECIVPLLFDKKIEPGSYKIVAKQKIYVFRKPNRQDIQGGELVSNSLDVQVK